MASETTAQEMEKKDEVREGDAAPQTPRVSDSDLLAMQDSYYRLKHIRISKKQTIPILLQNENGPCPLLAICTLYVRYQLFSDCYFSSSPLVLLQIYYVII
jgi:hypothetical protein